MVAWPCYGTMVVRKSGGRGDDGVSSGGGGGEARPHAKEIELHVGEV